MPDLQRAVPKPDQSCPICGARLEAGALYCEHCGNDLARAGMVLSSAVRPVSRRRRSLGGLVRRLRLPIAGAAAIAVLLVLASGVPAVGGRLPFLRSVADPVEDAVEAAWAWGAGLFSTPQKTSRSNPQKVSPRTAAPARVPRGASSYLIVRSSPEGANVYVNAERLGATPLVVSLPPGSYRVRLVREGYIPVARIVEIGKGARAEVALRLRPSVPQAAPTAKPPAAEAPQAAQQLPGGLQVGAAAPAFSMKDRFGVIHRLSDLRGRRVTLLFIWDLDESGKQAVRRLIARRGARETVVVLLRPDRVALRTFAAAERLTIPVLFGDTRVAAAYHVPDGVPVLYVLSESGRILSRRTAKE